MTKAPLAKCLNGVQITEKKARKTLGHPCFPHTYLPEYLFTLIAVYFNSNRPTKIAYDYLYANYIADPLHNLS